MGSQHDLVKFFCENMDSFGKVKDSLQATGFGRGKFECTPVESSRTALYAFRKMESTGFTALPVVDESNVVVATISAADVRGLTVDNIGDVLKPVLKFLESANNGTIDPPMTCTSDESLANVMRKLISGYHRHMWVVDSEGKIVNAVTLSDVIDFCSNNQSVIH